MMKALVSLKWYVLALILMALIFSANVKAENSATTPVPRAEKSWMDRHESMNARVKQGNVDMIFIGDSITHGWEGEGKDVWAKYYAKRNAVNLGIGGDKTEHVLWRLDNGNIEGISPKLAVLMIGTNNLGSNTEDEIAAGITAIVKKLQAKLPTTKILLLAIFPRDEKPDATREKQAKINSIIAKLDDQKSVFFLDIGAKFLDKDGTLPKDIMPDFLHPNAKGYAIEAEALEPSIVKLMGEAQK